MDTDAENIAEEARSSIGKFCSEECKSYCCRKGYLHLDAGNLNLVTQGRVKELEENKTLSKKGGVFSLYMGNHDQPCPSLKDCKCMIHDNPNRPLACKQFPIFLEGKNIRMSCRCPAIKEGLLYPYIARLIQLGYSVS